MIVESNTDEQWKKNRQMTQAGSRICRGQRMTADAT